MRGEHLSSNYVSSLQASTSKRPPTAHILVMDLTRSGNVLEKCSTLGVGGDFSYNSEPPGKGQERVRRKKTKRSNTALRVARASHATLLDHRWAPVVSFSEGQNMISFWAVGYKSNRPFDLAEHGP